MHESKKSKTNIYLKAGVWAMAAEILVRAVSFLSTPIFSRILPIDVYGDVKTFESWLNLLSPILALGLFTNIEIAQYQFKEKFQQYVSAILFLIVTVHGAIFCVALLLNSQLCRLLDFTPSMLVVAVLYCCFYSCILCLMRTQRILLQYKQAALLSLLATVPSLLLSMGCCLASQGRSDTQLLDIRIVSFYAPIVLLGAAVTASFLARQKVLVNLDYWRYGLKVSIPLIMYQISLQVLTQSDRIMIKQMVSPTAAAIFSIGTTVIYIVEIVHKGLESAWIPWLYHQLDTGRQAAVYQFMRLILVGFSIISLYLLLLGNEIILIFGGQQYLPAKWLLGPMLAGVIFQFFMLKLADVEKFYQKGSYVGVVSIIVAVLNLLLNYLGIKFWGYQAASYTTMLSYVVAVFIHLALIRAKIPQIRLPGLRFCGICTLSAILLISCMKLYRSPWQFRLAALVVLTLMVAALAVYIWRKYGKFWIHLSEN